MNELFALVLYSRGKYTDMPSLQCDYEMRVYGLLQSLRSKIELDKLSKLRIVKDTFEIRGIYAILYMIKFFKAVAPLLSFIALEVGISRKVADTSVDDVSATLLLYLPLYKYHTLFGFHNLFNITEWINFTFIQ